MVLTKVILYLGYPCLSLAGSLGREHLKGLLGLTLCLISVTTIGAIPRRNSIVHFFLQRCPSLNLWSNASPFSESLLFPISKPLYILFPLPGILFTEKKNQIHSSRPMPKPPWSYWPKPPYLNSHSHDLCHTGPLAPFNWLSAFTCLLWL